MFIVYWSSYFHFVNHHLSIDIMHCFTTLEHWPLLLSSQSHSTEQTSPDWLTSLIPQPFIQAAFRPAVQAAQCKNNLEADVAGGGWSWETSRGRHMPLACYLPPPSSKSAWQCITMTVRFVQNNGGTTVFILSGMFAMETCDNTHMSFSVFICSKNHSYDESVEKVPCFIQDFSISVTLTYWPCWCFKVIIHNHYVFFL
jgi:hypothetical protein